MKQFLILICFLIISSVTVSAQIIHVPGDYSSIQAGIDAAQNGDMVLVDDGTYLENINFSGKAITVASNFIIDGDTNHINNTIIDGSQPTHPDSGSVVYFISGEDTTSVLYGFTITGGTGTVSNVGAPRLGRVGGGIFIADVGAKISHNYIFNNSVADSFSVLGGGLAAGAPWSTSFVIIENNIFDSNSCLRSVAASIGGGMSIITKARVCNNIFSNNVVFSDSGEAFGGGFVAGHNLDSILIYNNLIINNKVETGIITNPTMDRALGAGFVLWNDSTAFIRMIGNTIAYNEVISSNYTVGAGGYFERTKGDVIFANNLLYGNHYSGSVSCNGSALNMRKAKVSIINNTITGNEPSINGALSTDLDDSSLLMNNILWGNSTGPSMPEIDIWTGSPPEIVYCDVEGGWTGEGNIDTDPLFLDTLYHLSDSSPCIGAGKDSILIGGFWYYAPPFDGEGNPRPNPPECMPDIGAQESPLCSTATTISINPTTLDFGEVWINNDSTMIFTITNTGSTDLEISSITSNEPAFTVNITSDTLASGDELDVEVTFTPTEKIQYNGIIEIAHNAVGSQDSVVVKGNGIPTGIADDLLNTLPADFIVYQNYPNPFNPRTSIVFGLPEASEVKLTLFNSLGEEVAILFEGYKNAGYHQMEFEASRLPSGFYFYQLRSGFFVETKKMILLK